MENDSKGRTRFKAYRDAHKTDPSFYFTTYEEFRRYITVRIESTEAFKNNPDAYMISFFSCMLILHFKERYEETIRTLESKVTTSEKQRDLIQERISELRTNIEVIPEMVDRMTRGLTFPALNMAPIELPEVTEEQPVIYRRCAECGVSGDWIECPECGKVPEQDMLTAVHRSQVGLVEAYRILESHDVDDHLQRLKSPQYSIITGRVSTAAAREIERLVLELARDADFKRNIYAHKLAVAKRVVDLNLKHLREMANPVTSLQKYVGRRKEKREIVKYYNNAIKEANAKKDGQGA